MKKITILSTLISTTLVSTFAWSACNTQAEVEKADQLWAQALATHDPEKSSGALRE